MAADGVFVQLHGVEEARRALRILPIHLRRRVLLGALKVAAQPIKKEARSRVRVLARNAPAVRAGRRISGLVRSRISVRVSKTAKERGNVGVFIGVRPAAGAKYRTLRRSVVGVSFKQRRLVKASDLGTARDPFYWRFLEFKTAKRPAYPFLQPAARSLPTAQRLFQQQLEPQIRRLNRNPKEIAP